MEISGKRCHAISFGWLLCFMHLQSFSGAAIPEESRSTLTELNKAPSTRVTLSSYNSSMTAKALCLSLNCDFKVLVVSGVFEYFPTLTTLSRSPVDTSVFQTSHSCHIVERVLLVNAMRVCEELSICGGDVDTVNKGSERSGVMSFGTDAKRLLGI